MPADHFGCGRRRDEHGHRDRKAREGSIAEFCAGPVSGLPAGDNHDEAVGAAALARAERVGDHVPQFAGVCSTTSPQALGVVALDGVPINENGMSDNRSIWESHLGVPPGGRIEFIVKGPPEGVKGRLITRGVNTGSGGENDPEPATGDNYRVRASAGAALKTGCHFHTPSPPFFDLARKRQARSNRESYSFLRSCRTQTIPTVRRRFTSRSMARLPSCLTQIRQFPT